MRRPTILIAMLTLAGVGALAGESLVGAADRGLDPGRSFEPRAAHPVTAPSGPVVAAKARRPSLTYLETGVFSIAGQTEDTFRMSCQRRNKAINGYFANSAPGLVLDFSAVNPTAHRRWNFGVLNLNDQATEPINYYTGIVCAKRL